MLLELRISNFAIIDGLDIFFQPGMTALVGETGAGKSIIVQALGLLSGKRAEFDKLKDDSKKAFVEGTFAFSDSFILAHPALKDYLDQKTLTVSRTLLPSKSAVSRLNGETVSLNVLKTVMEGVIDIHSQLDSAYLYDESNYLGLIDSFPRSTALKEAKEAYFKAYQAVKEAKEAKEAFIKENDLSQRDFLSYQKDEIDKMHLKPHEIEDLNQELAAMQGYEKLDTAFSDLSQTCLHSEEGADIQEELSLLSQKLSAFSATPLAEEAEKAKATAQSLAEELDGLAERFGDMDFSPARLEQINSRLFALTSLQHKYGKSTEDILNAYALIKARLEALDSFKDRLADLEKDIASKEQDQAKSASKLTAEREQAAQGLSAAVNQELTSLGLLAGGFSIELAKGDFGPEGQDKAVFLICLNKGGKKLPLKEAISGGESSRLTLALKAVFNALAPYDTLAFDEIDTGISGQIASKAAEKIYQISRSSLVIAISHLPQVVARAENAFYVYKDSQGEMTSSHIEPIEGKRIDEELAKMISGSQVTPSALKAAKDLRASYQAKKA